MYAVDPPRQPRSAIATAARRWAEETSGTGILLLVSGGDVDHGWATRIMPPNETRPAYNSRRVKGVCRTTEHAKETMMGVRNVITVPGARGRYWKESRLVSLTSYREIVKSRGIQ